MLATLRRFVTRFFGSDEVELHFAAPPPTADLGERQHYFSHPDTSARAAETADYHAGARGAVRVPETQGAARG